MSVASAFSWCHEFSRIDDIQVYHIDLTPNSEREAAAFHLLDSHEQARWRRFGYRRPQREFALVRAALRAVLCGQLGCRSTQLELCVTDYGKPFALVEQSRTPISFNVSHSGNHGLIGVSDSDGKRLGVDVEMRLDRTDIDEIASLVFTSNEQAEVADARGWQKTCLFYKIWTLKEALIKALGTGFFMDTTQFEIPPEMRLGALWSLFRFPKMPDVCWKIQNLGNEHMAAAVAYEYDPL